MVRISAVLGTALLLPCYVLVAFSPTAVDAGKVHGSSSAMAAPSITTKTELHCITVLGRGQANHPLPSKTATVTERRQETVRLTSTPVVTVTAAKSTVSVTSTQTQVVTSTDSAVTDTLTVTTTPSTTQTLTITATSTTTVDGGITTSTTTSTSVVPTPSNFIPITWQFGGRPVTTTTTTTVGTPIFTLTVSRRNALPTVAADFGLGKRGRTSNHRNDYGVSAKKGDKKQLQAKEYVCVKDVVIVKKYTKVKVAPASTVTKAGATRTKSVTVTATSTVTVAPPNVSATVTSTAATVTSTASVTTTETATSTLYTTVTASATATSYAACASNNFLTKIDGRTLRTVFPNDPRTSPTVQQTTGDPESCCAQCQATPNCNHFASKDGLCTLFGNDRCPAAYDFTLFAPGDDTPGFTAGNGACGDAGM